MSEMFQVEIYDYDRHTASNDTISAFDVSEVCEGVHHIYVELDIKDACPEQFMQDDNTFEVDLYPDNDRLIVLRVKAREPTTFFFNYMGRGVFEFIAIRQDKHHKIVGGE